MYEKLSVLSTLTAILWTIVFLAMDRDGLALRGLVAFFVLGLVFHAVDVRRRRAAK